MWTKDMRKAVLHKGQSSSGKKDGLKYCSAGNVRGGETG